MAELRTPTDHPFFTKRPPLENGYYDTFNRDNVTLLDVRNSPIEEITEAGVRTADAEYEVDAIVFATGFDAMTGTLTGPQSPSVLSNMVVSIEQHADWIADCLVYLREHGCDRIEALADAERQWPTTTTRCPSRPCSPGPTRGGWGPTSRGGYTGVAVDKATTVLAEPRHARV